MPKRITFCAIAVELNESAGFIGARSIKPGARAMTRRKTNIHRIDVGVTLTEWTALKRAACALQTNTTAFVRAVALRAATRSDAVVRGHVRRMLARDAENVRLLADCGMMMTRINELATYALEDQKLKDATTQLSERIAEAIKKIGSQR
jgi:hypothetical protein